MNRHVARGIQVALSSLGLGVLTSVSLAATPTEQQAIVQTGNGGPEVLKLQTVPVLEPGEGQVLVRVYAASVNPIDWKIRQGMMNRRPGNAGGPPGGGAGGPGGPGGAGAAGGPGGPSGPGGPGGGAAASAGRIPGSDIAGVVEKVGPGVTNVKVGESVFSQIGMGGGGALNGAYSQYALAPAASVLAKPATLTYAQAAGLGTAAITGARWIEQLGLAKGQTVLITGVAGGVGSSAAQIAKADGLHVVGTASARHAAFLKSIGVTDVLDYTTPDWAAKAKSMKLDAVFDTVGGDSAKAAFGALKSGSKYAAVGEPATVTADMCTAAMVTCFDSGPGGSRGASQSDLLVRLAKLAGEGKFVVNVDKSYPLAQAGDAQEYNRAGHTEGKVIIAVTDKANSK